MCPNQNRITVKESDQERWYNLFSAFSPSYCEELKCNLHYWYFRLPIMWVSYAQWAIIEICLHLGHCLYH